MDYDSWKLATPPQFEDETEDEYTDCDLCGDTFLVENIESMGIYKCVCPYCIIPNEENK